MERRNEDNVVEILDSLKVKVEEWAFIKDPYDASYKVLVGRLAEDHHKSDHHCHLIKGHRIVSSTIELNTIVKIRNTWYELIGPERKETIEEINKEKGMCLEAVD
jgi:hypothetical protein